MTLIGKSNPISQLRLWGQIGLYLHKWGVPYKEARPGKIIFVYIPPRIKAALPKAAMVEAWVSLKLRALVLSLVRDSTAEPP